MADSTADTTADTLSPKVESDDSSSSLSSKVESDVSSSSLSSKVESDVSSSFLWPKDEIQNLTAEEAKLDDQIRESQERLTNLSEDEYNKRLLFVHEDDSKNLPCFQNKTLIAVKAPHVTLEVPDPNEVGGIMKIVPPEPAERLQFTFPERTAAYDLLEKIGNGIHKALCIVLQENVAIKILDTENCEDNLVTILQEENAEMGYHPNLMKAHCRFLDESKKHLWIVMPLMVNVLGVFEEPEIATILREVLKALIHIHSRGYVHGDIKASKIFLDNGKPVLGGFGISNRSFSNVEKLRVNSKFQYWKPPEKADGYTSEADMWALGITALELAHGPCPFVNDFPKKVVTMTLHNSCEKKFSSSFRTLVSSLLAKTPKHRPTASHLLHHPFFKNSNPYVCVSPVNRPHEIVNFCSKSIISWRKYEEGVGDLGDIDMWDESP